MTDDYGLSDNAWMGIEWREHLRTLDVHGARVNYVDVGPRRRTKQAPILFVHGLSGCWQNWLENIPHFAARHRVIALDLPGFGASPMPRWEVEIPAYGRLINDFCTALELDACVLVGNSMGGFIAAEAAINYPGQVSRLVLVSAAGISQTSVRRHPVMAFARMASAAGPSMLESAHRSVSRPGLRQLSYGMVFRYPNRLRPELLFEQHVNGVGRPGFIPALSALLPYDFRDRLPQISKPTLIVWGRNDQIVPPADADEFERLIPGSRKVMFERTGHVPQMERPARFNRVLEEFISDSLSADFDSTGRPTVDARPATLRLVNSAFVRRRGAA